MLLKRIPAIYVYDRDLGLAHLVGTESHDHLYIDGEGCIQYRNLQNGMGTPDTYRFIGDDEVSGITNTILKDGIPMLTEKEYQEALRL